MLAYFEQFVKHKIYLGLILANFLLVLLLIIFQNLGILPLHLNDFLFFAVLTLLFALYRPGWAFLFFIGTLALENINLAPRELGISLRPYQLLGALTFLAVFIRFIFKRLNFTLPKLKWFDVLPSIIVVSSFLSALASSERNASLKISIILFSFLVLYFLVRIFIRTFDDLKRILPFFLSSALIVSFYGIWQNIQFKFGANSFEVMPGRPNATFAEPDWLGIYLVFNLAVIFSIIYFLKKASDNQKLSIFNFQFSIFNKFSIFTFLNFKLFVCLLFLVSCFLSLILTVSRSAWLGAFLLYVIYATIVYTNLKFDCKNWNFREIAKQKFFVISALVLAIILVYVFNLTTFKLFERAQSTGGMQKITIACPQFDCVGCNLEIPKYVKNIEEIKNLGCEHINLEDREAKGRAGYKIYEIYREDPNVNIRKNIYQKSWEQIKNHPLFGIGWGSIGKVLGTDERGAALNSSNIFLEVYLGSGLLGILAFIAIWIWLLISAVKFFQKENEQKFYGLFLILGSIAFLIPNLFNAGIMLGILWIFFGITLL